MEVSVDQNRQEIRGQQDNDPDLCQVLNTVQTLRVIKLLSNLVSKLKLDTICMWYCLVITLFITEVQNKRTVIG